MDQFVLQVKTQTSNLAPERGSETCHSCRIVYCQKVRCLTHHGDGSKQHCGSCFPEQHTVNSERPPLVPKDVKIVECHGRECRCHGGQGRGVHCKSCFGVWNPLTQRLEYVTWKM